MRTRTNCFYAVGKSETKLLAYDEYDSHEAALHLPRCIPQDDLDVQRLRGVIGGDGEVAGAAFSGE
jgi:hypothetical protein